MDSEFDISGLLELARQAAKYQKILGEESTDIEEWAEHIAADVADAND